MGADVERVYVGPLDAIEVYVCDEYPEGRVRQISPTRFCVARDVYDDLVALEGVPFHAAFAALGAMTREPGEEM